jgi:hypothetical protein
MRIACWVTKATDTHSEYVILIAFAKLQWLCVCASLLRYTYIDCLVGVFSQTEHFGMWFALLLYIPELRGLHLGQQTSCPDSCFVVCLSPPRHILGQYLKLDYNSILLYHFQFIILSDTLKYVPLKVLFNHNLLILQFQPMKPDEFAAVLINKLECIKREQEAQEKLDRKLQEVCGRWCRGSKSQSAGPTV